MFLRKLVIIVTFAAIGVLATHALPDSSQDKTGYTNTHINRSLTSEKTDWEPSAFTARCQELAAEGAAVLRSLSIFVIRRVGWMKPESDKEWALFSLAIALAVPGLMAPILRHMFRMNHIVGRLLAVAALIGSACHFSWMIWGQSVGFDQFKSTMIVAIPMLYVYFDLALTAQCDRKVEVVAGKAREAA